MGSGSKGKQEKSRLSYEEREKMKQEGWDFFTKAKTAHGKTHGLLRVVTAHYWRQREVFEEDRYAKKHLRMVLPKKYYPGYILENDHYTPHWIHSMRDKIPDDVMKVLEDQWGYKPTKSAYLPDGHTIYVFPDRNN
jgi:hypothetical protein